MLTVCVCVCVNHCECLIIDLESLITGDLTLQSVGARVDSLLLHYRTLIVLTYDTSTPRSGSKAESELNLAQGRLHNTLSECCAAAEYSTRPLWDLRRIHSNEMLLMEILNIIHSAAERSTKLKNPSVSHIESHPSCC